LPKAWERELAIRQGARPRLLAEEEQTWDAISRLRDFEDGILKLLWHSEVPGSGAPECLMLGAVQAAENRGLDVSAAEVLLAEGLEALERGDLAALHGLTSQLLRKLDRAPADPSSPYWSFRQVETWEEHEALVRFPAPVPVDRREFAARVRAGWVGQIVGGALGTALEGYTAERIAEAFGDVTGYVRPPNTFNDDITFELAFLEAFARRGHAVTSADIAERWVALIPFGWSAEYIALENLKLGVYPPESGTRSNPFREWIGAQMRGGICGLVAPGDAREAARLAWTDGVISHAGNGVLGDVFNAVLTSLAFVRRNVRSLLEEAAALIPEGTQYRWVLDQALAACREAEEGAGFAGSDNLAGNPAEDVAGEAGGAGRSAGDGGEGTAGSRRRAATRAAWDRCEKLLERYNWVHAYPNAAAEVVALWFGEGDFDLTMSLTAMCGQDVDCNAAQVGGVLGVLRGGGPLSEAVPARWTEPIGDTLETYVRGLERVKIDELAQRTVDAVHRVALGRAKQPMGYEPGRAET